MFYEFSKKSGEGMCLIIFFFTEYADILTLEML